MSVDSSLYADHLSERMDDLDEVTLRATRAMTATREAFRIAFASHDEGTCTHATWDQTEVAFAGAYSALAGHQNLLAIVAFPCDVVVMAIDRLDAHRRAWLQST